MIGWVALVLLVWSAPEGGYPKGPVGVASSVCPSNVTIHPDTCITGLGCELNICIFNDCMTSMQCCTPVQ